MPVLIEELFTLYAQRDAATSLPATAALRGYFAWLTGQERTGAEAAWAGVLAGASPTLVAPGFEQEQQRAQESVRTELPAQLTARLQQRLRGAGLTLNTAVQGAWGVVLAGLTGRTDVVFGSTVSGRPAESPASSGWPATSSTPCRYASASPPANRSAPCSPGSRRSRQRCCPITTWGSVTSSGSRRRPPVRHDHGRQGHATGGEFTAGTGRRTRRAAPDRRGQRGRHPLPAAHAGGSGLDTTTLGLHLGYLPDLTGGKRRGGCSTRWCGCSKPSRRVATPRSDSCATSPRSPRKTFWPSGRVLNCPDPSASSSGQYDIT